MQGWEVYFSATFSWTSPLSDRKVPNIAALVYRHDNFSRNDLIALKVDAVWHGCADVFLLNFCVASFWTGFKNLQRQNANSAQAVSCNRSVVNFPGKDFFLNPFSFDLCDTYFTCCARNHKLVLSQAESIFNQNIEDLKVRIKCIHLRFRIQNLRIRDQTGQTPNLKMFQTRYKSGKITSSA